MGRYGNTQLKPKAQQRKESGPGGRRESMRSGGATAVRTSSEITQAAAAAT